MVSRKSLVALPPALQALIQALVAGALALWLSSAQADKSDRAQPLNFASDSARVDDVRRVNILKGNVEITKGTILLRADVVEVQQGQDGSQTAIATGGRNGRAYFKQRREGLDEFIEGEAERIDFDGRADLVTFKGRAVMRRLTGATLSDEVVGQTIVYDNKTEVFQVLGGTGSAAGNGRVKGVISPRKEKALPADKPERSGAAVPEGEPRLAVTPALGSSGSEGASR